VNKAFLLGICILKYILITNKSHKYVLSDLLAILYVHIKLDTFLSDHLGLTDSAFAHKKGQNIFKHKNQSTTKMAFDPFLTG